MCRAPRGARGLKQRRARREPCAAASRPARGAWIETDPCCADNGPDCRAPRGARGLKPRESVESERRRAASRPARGAWIETHDERACAARVSEASRPARGAWIETTPSRTSDCHRQRRAPRGARGLKLVRTALAWPRQCRAPRGARGLKRIGRARPRWADGVAPRAGRVD